MTAREGALEAVENLYPYAVQLRYEAALADEPLDRADIIELIDRLSEWALGSFADGAGRPATAPRLRSRRP